jgi:hypothetical protein
VRSPPPAQADAERLLALYRATHEDVRALLRDVPARTRDAA